MIRKLLLFAAFVISTATVVAQTGEWTLFTQFTGNVDNLLETKQKVYYTAGDRLFSFDKESNETYAYTTRNKLNDTNVKLVRYNPAGKYLFVGYDNGNIDLLYDNGAVVNMSDIKDATLTYNKGLRNVVFAGGRIYLATEFGLVIFDDKKHEVVESGIFGVPVNFVFPVGDYLFITHANTKAGLYYAPLKGHHNTIDKFTYYTDLNPEWLYPLGTNSFVYSNPTKSGLLTRYTFKFDDGVPALAEEVNFKCAPRTELILAPNAQYVVTSSSIVMVDDNGDMTDVYSLPEPLQGKKVATLGTPRSVWASDAEGLANYDVSGGELTILSDKFKPEGIVTNEVFFAKFDNHGALWTGNLACTQYKGGYKGDYTNFRQAMTRIKNGKPEDMNLYDASADIDVSQNAQKSNGDKRMYGGCTGFAIDPEYPNRYYQGNNMEGIYVVEDGVELHKFGRQNAGFLASWGTRVMDVAFDPDGNLWVALWYSGSDRGPVRMLKKSTLRNKPFDQMTADDWISSKHQGISKGGKDHTLLFCKKSPVLFTFYNYSKLGVLKTKGTWDNLDDDTYFELNGVRDQDGNVWNVDHIVCGVEDHNGEVWLGTSAGVVKISDPASLTETSTIHRIKVPRNDGTQYADYLCETDLVYGIAVDPSNRKWIATESSGVYLVSEDGTEILEHFTTDNSPLPSNMVLSVACDPNSNAVYFGLMSGLLSYNSDSSPAAEDYSEVYAYPNPVRPDYSGYITITGLMENSLVKITDNIGNVVFQTRSEGGMAIWDGFDTNHNPAKSGVYYVFASQDPNGTSTGAVTKILIVR